MRDSRTKRRLFGDELKRLRGQESLRSLARRIGYNAGDFSRFERGLRRPAPDIVRLLDRELSAGGRLIEIAATALFHLDSRSVERHDRSGHNDLHENEDCMPLSRRDFITTATLGTYVPQIMFNRNADIDYLDHFRQLNRVLVAQRVGAVDQPSGSLASSRM